MSTALPTDKPCAVVNFPLWQIFTEAFRAQTGKPANPLLWTEAEVVQWLDTECRVVVDYGYDDATL